METIKNLKITYRYAKNEKKRLIFYIFCHFILCAIGAFTPYFLAKQLLMITEGDFHQLVYLSILLLLILIFYQFVSYFSKKNSQIFFRTTLRNIQVDVSEEILKIKMTDLDKNSTGVFLERITKDTGKMAEIFNQLSRSFTDIITNVSILGTIAAINIYIFLFFCLSVISIFVFERIKIIKYNQLDKEYRFISENRTSLIGELIRGIRDIRTLHSETSYMKVVTSKITELNEKRYEMGNIKRRYEFLTKSMSHIFEFIFIILGISLVRLTLLEISTFVILYMYQDKIYTLLTKFATLLEQLKDFNLSANRVFEITENNCFSKEQFGKKHINTLNGEIEFKNVNFSYHPEKLILKNINFQIKDHQTTAFVGKSGSGKSTVFNLLTKLYMIDSGKITIDHYDILDLDQDSIRNNISVINQFPYIFNMSMRENLKIANENMTEKEMITACKTAELHDYIMTLKEKYDTLVGENGVSLSGGQRQRLAIARALLHKSNIILFDEATSALDNETQKDIQESINKLKNKYTILIIAHRLSSIINADKIILMENGIKLEEGTHEELLKKSKEYQHLYNMEQKNNLEE